MNLRIRRPSFFGVEPAPRPTPPETVETTFAEVKRWLLDGSVRRHLFRYHAVELQTANVSHVSKPFPTALLLRLLSRGRCSFVDDAGRRVEIGAAELFRLGLRFARDLAGIPWLLARVRRDVRRLAAAAEAARDRPGLNLAGPPLYLRGDLLLDGLGIRQYRSAELAIGEDGTPHRSELARLYRPGEQTARTFASITSRDSSRPPSRCSRRSAPGPVASRSGRPSSTCDTRIRSTWSRTRARRI